MFVRLHVILFFLWCGFLYCRGFLMRPRSSFFNFSCLAALSCCCLALELLGGVFGADFVTEIPQLASEVSGEAIQYSKGGIGV